MSAIVRRRLCDPASSSATVPVATELVTAVVTARHRDVLGFVSTFRAVVNVFFFRASMSRCEQSSVNSGCGHAEAQFHGNEKSSRCRPKFAINRFRCNPPPAPPSLLRVVVMIVMQPLIFFSG